MRKYSFAAIATVLLFVASTCGNNPTFYVLKSRYNDETKAYFSLNKSIQPYVYLSDYMFGKFSEKEIIKVLNRYLPDIESSDVVALNIENQIYKDLRDGQPGAKKTEDASREFVRIVGVIKRERPNIKIGIYGVPFRFFYDSQRKVNDIDKFTDIFNAVDYISPSLYMMYPDHQIGKERNRNYIEANIKYSLELGERFGKPVIPWVWNVVHTSNKEFGGKLFSKEEFLNYVSSISSVTHRGKRVSGVLYWDPGEKSFSTLMDQNRDFSDTISLDRNSLIKYYLEAFKKN